MHTEESTPRGHCPMCGREGESLKQCGFCPCAWPVPLPDGSYPGGFRAPATPEEQGPSIAALVVLQRNALSAAIGAIGAAWEVWGEAQHEIRRLVRTAEWSGDLPDAAQRAALNQQFSAQIFEAYARARLQVAIVRAVDGVDQVADYDRHWAETWGETTTHRAAVAYADKLAAALERQRTARAAALAQRDALERAGVPA